MGKRNIIITYILLLIIILVLSIMVFYYKGKANKTCPKCDTSINNINSSTNQNTDSKVDNSTNEDIINTGKTLWNNTYNLYWNFMKNIKTNEINLGENKINNMNDFDFTSLTDSALKELYNSLGVKNDNGTYYIESLRTKGDETYMTSEITLKENKDNKITYNVESKYCASGDKNNCKDIASVNSDFVIIKESNNYKVESFILPD